MTLAILCSGQGGQHRDMFALTSDAPEAAQLFTHATALLGGRDPREFVRGEADGVLHHNRAGQILCTLQPLAAACALADVIPRGVIVAGYSVGEVAAWGVGGLFDATATLDLVARRAEAMDAATHAGDGLIFVRGLSRDEIGRLCERHGAAIAIVNPGDAFVIGGGREALSGIAAERAGRRTAQGSSRCRLRWPPTPNGSPRRRAVFRETLRLVPMVFPPRSAARILSGIDGTPVVSADSGLDKLAAQISQTVQWADCLQLVLKRVPRGFSKLRAGTAPSRADGRGNRGRTSGSLPGRFQEPSEGVRAWVARHLSA